MESFSGLGFDVGGGNEGDDDDDDDVFVGVDAYLLLQILLVSLHHHLPSHVHGRVGLWGRGNLLLLPARNEVGDAAYQVAAEAGEVVRRQSGGLLLHVVLDREALLHEAAREPGDAAAGKWRCRLAAVLADEHLAAGAVFRNVRILLLLRILKTRVELFLLLRLSGAGLCRDPAGNLVGESGKHGHGRTEAEQTRGRLKIC